MKSAKNWGRLGMKFDVVQLESTGIDVIDGDRGKNYPHQNELLSTGFCLFLSAKNVTKSGFSFSETQFISQRKDALLNNGRLCRGDIVITTRGTVGNVALYSPQVPYENIRINSGMLIIRCANNISNQYLYQVLRSEWFQKQIMAVQSGSAQPQLPKSHFLKMNIPLPPLPIQEKIASILQLIDDKITTNNSINDNLEQQAKALYKDWFLDFSPFSSDGTLPDGWRIGTVGDIIQLHDSKRVPLSGTERSKMAKLYPYYGATSLMDYVDNYLFDGIYLLLGEDGTVVDNLGFPILQYVYGRFWVNNHAHIITGKEGFSVEELYLFFGLTNIKSIVTGAVQQKVSQQNLKKVPAIIPSSTALSSFDELIQPIFSQIRNLRDENARLTSLRDILLPKLMSGELDVSAVNL